MSLKYIGTITKTHGVQGECTLSDVSLVPLVPPGSPVQLGYSASYGKAYTLGSIKKYKNGALIKLQGVDSIEEAEKLKELGIFIEESLMQTQEGDFFDDDILGCSVIEESSAAVLGTVSDIWKLPAHNAYVVTTPDGREVPVPVVDAIVKTVNLRAKTIVVNPPEGMF